MKAAIEIVDRGRGLQLSTSRITVQDLVPYFQARCSYDEIMRWVPSLSAEEIAVVERYYREHQEELDNEDHVIRQRREDRIRQQRLRAPEPDGATSARLARLKELLRQRHREQNGAGHPG